MSSAVTSTPSSRRSRFSTQNAQRIREDAGIGDDRVEAEDVVRIVADGELRTCTKAVESHAGEATLRLCGRPSSPSTSAAPSSRRAWCATTARSSDRVDAPTPATSDADDALRDAAPRSSTGSTRRASTVAVGVGCGGPMDARRRARLAAEHPRVARLPAAGAPRRAHRAARVGRQRRQGARARRRLDRRGRAACATTSGWSCRPGVGGGIVLDGRLLDGADGNAGHVGHVIVEPDGHECGCGARGCVEAEASGTAIARITGAPPADARPRRCARAPARSSAARSRRSRTCSTCRSRSSAVRSRSATASRSSPPRRREIDARCRLDFSRGTRVVPGALGADGPLIGAAAVALFSDCL